MRERGEIFQPGGFYDLNNNYLGPHEGIEFFTIGQRKGLPGGGGTPRYVVDIDAATGRVVLGGEEDLLCEEFTVTRATWHETPPDAHSPKKITVKVRHGHTGEKAAVNAESSGTATVRTFAPLRAVTPGQAAVFYDGDRVVGGGWIARRNIVANPASQPAPVASEMVLS